MSDQEMNDSASEPEFEIEKIVKSRQRGEETEFLIKWRGYPDDDNTWEPESNVNAVELLIAFKEEEERKKKRDSTPKARGRPTRGRGGGPGSRSNATPRSDKSASKSNQSEEDVKVEPKDKKPSGVDLNLPVENVVSVKVEGKDLLFELKFKDRTKTELVSSRVANIKYINQLIAFYKKKLAYYENTDNVNGKA
jgi:chromobox protein 1